MTCLLCHCGGDDRVVYTRFVDIPRQGWSADEFCEFNTADADSSLFAEAGDAYNVILTIRHTDLFPYRELFLPVVQSEQISASLPDTLRVPLTSTDGGWRGRHSKGIYVVSDTLLRDIRLPNLYFIRLYHAMPESRLGGLLSVGIIIEKSSHH